MRISPLVARLSATALLALATTAAAVLPAHGATGRPAGPPVRAVAGTADDADDYELLLTSETARTDFEHRTVDLIGTLVHTDLTPVVNAPVTLGESVMFETWNPFGDPIDPIEREVRTLGTVQTDENGHFILPDVVVDRSDTEPSLYLRPINEVEFFANWDSDPAHDDPLGHDIVFDQYDIATTPVTSDLTYQADKKKVRPGDTLTVTGKVSWPDGHGPVAGTRVFMRTDYELEYEAQTTTDADGNYTLSVEVDEWARGPVQIFSVPTDYYIAGAAYDLPVQVVQP